MVSSIISKILNLKAVLTITEAVGKKSPPNK